MTENTNAVISKGVEENFTMQAEEETQDFSKSSSFPRSVCKTNSTNVDAK